MTKIIRKYLIITFLITYMVWCSLAVLTHLDVLGYGSVSFMILYILGGLGPVFGAFLSFENHKEDFKRFIKQLTKFKVSIFSYLLIIILPILISLIAWIIVYYFYAEVFQFLKEHVYMVFVVLIPMIGTIGLAEIGWRGVLLPQLLKIVTPLWATIITTIIWIIWHIPLWFIKGTDQFGTNFFYFVILIFGISFLLSRFYMKSGSIPITILFYSMVNAYFEIGLNWWATAHNYQLVANTTFLIIGLFLFFNMSNKDATVLSAYNYERGRLGIFFR